MKETIEKLIEKELTSLGAKNPKVVLDHPSELSHGDYASSVALSFTKELNISPRELAEKIAGAIRKENLKEIEKIEIAGPGFINFRLSKEFFASSIQEILKQGEKFGRNEVFKKQKTIVEYTDPNPFKEFHIGHLMSNAIGESTSRIFEWSGAEVKRANYQGDVGLHVAKAIWAIKKQTLDPDNIATPVLGRMYVAGSIAYEQNTEAKKEIDEINKNIYNRENKNTNQIYDKGRKISLQGFEEVYKRLGTKFDYYFFESETGKFGKEIVEKNIGKVFEIGENGAIIFKGSEEEGLHTRVFLNSEGLPTYEAKELGLAKIKYDKYHYEKSIVITGNEVNDYFRVLLKAMSLIFPELAAKTVHISHGMLRLPSGKMSSRTGDVISAEDLIKDVKTLVNEKIKNRELTAKEKEEISEEVAIGAIKYSILKQGIRKDIIFDFEKSLSFEGDSGPYLQYTATRAQSVLNKAKKEGIKADTKAKNTSISEVERLLYRLSEVVERAGKEYQPQYIATYLTELASAFNAFYAHGKIVDKNDPTSSYKVALTQAVVIALKNGLYLLGISVPPRM